MVEEGLKAGDRIVVAGLQRIRPGVIVAPNEVPMNAPVKAVKFLKTEGRGSRHEYFALFR